MSPKLTILESRWSAALCASLVLHGLLTCWLLHGYVRGLEDHLTQTGVARPALMRPPPPADPDDQIGQHDAAGTAIAPAAGDEPLIALQADQDQPLLGRTPPSPGQRGAPTPPAPAIAPTPVAPLSSAVAPPTPATPKPPIETAAIAPPKPAPETAKPQTAVDTRADTSPPPKPAAVQVAVATPADAPPAKPDQATPTPPSPPAQRPSPPMGSAAPMADTEVDPFTKTPIVGLVRNGRVDVQAGRKANLVAPKLGIAGGLDAFQLGGRAVVMFVRIGADGRVTDVSIQRSSGSDTIDQACSLAMFGSWFEPRHDAAGHALPDAFPFEDKFSN